MKRLLLTLLAACSTLAETAGGDSNLPTAGAGPFRKLAAAEVRGAAPYVLDVAASQFRQPAALALAGDGELALYVVMKDAQSRDIIARSHALDARTFYGATQDLGHHAQAVLSADQAWEGSDLSHPSVLATPSGVSLYYTANGAVGLARSSDGLTFTKSATPVLAPDALGPIGSASIAMLPDGTFLMMFAQGGSIYEATSADGSTWLRKGTEPVLAPAAPKTTLAVGELPPFDTLSVSDPCLAPRMTPGGRLQIRVLYTGLAIDAGAVPEIGFAARYDDGPLARAPGDVFTLPKNISSPALFEWSEGSFLYVDADSSDGSHRAIVGAISPPTITLDPPGDFPGAP